TPGENGEVSAKPSSASPLTSRPARVRRTNSRLALILCIGMAAVLLGESDTASRISGVPTNFTSHQLCSAVFVRGLDPTEYYKQAVAPKLGAAGKLLRYDVDRERREVRVSLAGLVQSRAVDEGPFGCRVIHRGAGFAVAGDEKADTHTASPPVWIAGPDPVESKNAALSQALQRAFIEPESAPHRYTKAVVILHHGHVVGERYAPGITPATPLIGWSMTK